MKTNIVTVIRISVIFMTMTLVSCSNGKKSAEGPREVLAENAIELNEAQFSTSGIKMGLIGDHSVNATLKVNGLVNVTPQNIASVSAPLGGFVKSTNLVQGSAVSKGQALAMIENFTYIEIQQNYLETKARFQYAETEFKRHSELHKENVYSEKNVQQTEVDYKTLKAELKGLEQKLTALGIDPLQLTEDRITGQLPLYAPISGYIRMVNINLGKYVNPSDVLFEIVNPHEVILELPVFEKDIRKVRSGQQVSFTTPNDPGKIYHANIYQAGHTLNNDKLSMVYAKIEQPDDHLLSGMYVNAEIKIDQRSSLSVPQDAVVHFYEKSYIFIFKGIRMENGKKIHDFMAIEVITGDTGDGYTGIKLPDGTDISKSQIVIQGAYTLLSAWKNAGEMAC